MQVKQNKSSTNYSDLRQFGSWNLTDTQKEQAKALWDHSLFKQYVALALLVWVFWRSTVSNEPYIQIIVSLNFTLPIR